MEHKQHQYTEVNSGKTEGHMKYKDMMCVDCGKMKRLHEDGRMEDMENNHIKKENKKEEDKEY